MRARGIKLGPKCLIGDHCRVLRGFGGMVQIGAHTELQHGVLLHAYGGRITIDCNTFVGPFVVVYGHGSVSIGRDTLIAMHCRILSSNHSVPSMGIDIRSQPDVLLPTKIGNDVWLGAGVTVLGGITIGDGCVVGAGAVVTADLPPGAIVYGVPAKIHSWRKNTAGFGP